LILISGWQYSTDFADEHQEKSRDHGHNKSFCRMFHVLLIVMMLFGSAAFRSRAWRGPIEKNPFYRLQAHKRNFGEEVDNSSP